MGWQGHRGYRRQRDTRLPTILLVFFVGVLIWIAVGPRSLATQGPDGTATPIALANATVTASPSPEPLPACGVGDVPAWHGQLTDWQITLLDTTYTLSSSYVPLDLVPVAQAGFTEDDKVRAFVIDDLRRLNSAALADHITLTINSAYRSYDDQAAIFAKAQASFGSSLAALAAAKPGHSEHQLGTAIDFGAAVEGTNWLAANAWKFGFLSSFPPDSSPAFTCYKYEPWHYRYFGRDTASAIHNSGLTTREWLWSNAPPPRGYGATPTPRRTPTPSPPPSGLLSPSVSGGDGSTLPPTY